MTAASSLKYVVLLMLLALACGEETEVESPEGARVVVEEFKYSSLPGGARIVTGRLHNPTSVTIPGAQIQISLFDADNRRVSTMSVEVRDLKPGEHRAFREAVDSDQDVRGARVRSVLLM